MNKEQLESLPYPMFETTEEEKIILAGVLDNTEYEHLCNRIREYKHGATHTTSVELIAKIQISLGLAFTLEEYFGNLNDWYDFDEHGFELRNIWIRKLLAYKPE